MNYNRRRRALVAMMERGTPNERCIARARLAELPSPPAPPPPRKFVSNYGLKYLKNAMQFATVVKDIERPRKQRSSRAAGALIGFGWGINIAIAPALQRTGDAFGMFGLGCILIGLWFTARPAESRITIARAMLFAAWISLISWYSEVFWQTFFASRWCA